MKVTGFLLIALSLVGSVSLKAEVTTNQPAESPVVIASLNADFVSVEQFVQSLQAFDPTKAKNGIADLFSAIQDGQPEENDTGTRIYANRIQSVKILFQNDKGAVVFAEARPPTEAAPSSVGVLFLFHRRMASRNGGFLIPSGFILPESMLVFPLR